MQLDNLLSQDRVICQIQASSKKRALETMCEQLALGQDSLDASLIFSCMLERERLGSTGVGHGVAIPHSRMEGVEKALVAVATLSEGIDYDSIDDQPVDILFALLVPQECTEEHLQILASAAEMFSNESFTHLIRKAESSEKVYQLLTNWRSQDLSA